MSALTQQEIEVLAIQLDGKEAHLHAMVEAAGASETTDAQREQGDESDLADREILQRQNDALLEHYRMELADIEAARARIRLDQYGVCTDCGQPIPFPRMLAYPTAKRCAACQRRHERLYARPPATRPHGD